MTTAQGRPRPRHRTLFSKMWRSLLLLMVVTFLVHAVLVTGTLQLGSEAQTRRRLDHIGRHWGAQPPLAAPLALDPVTVVYPRYDLLPPRVRQLLPADARGIFELGSRAEDYFVQARAPVGGGPAFYVVEFHAQVKPNETIEYQVLSWYLLGMVPFGLVLLWACRRITDRVAGPMQDVGRQVAARTPGSLDPLHLPGGASLELTALVAQINSALHRTAEVIDRERSFTQFASHELRTPVAVIQSALERLDVHADAPQARPLARAHRGLRDMHALIDTFLQLSTEAGRPLTSAPVRVDAGWISALFHHLGGGQADHAFTVTVEAPLVVDAPATMLHVLVGNLLKNALFHGGPEPIEVTVSAQALTVRNHLLPASSPSAPGFGLGSRIAHRICARIGWTFTLELSAGLAVATVRLPDDRPRLDPPP